MSRLIRRTAVRNGYTPEHISVLLHGWDWQCAFRYANGPSIVGARDRDYECNLPEPAPQLARKRIAWESLRDELLPSWIAKRPFTRPWAWWQFDAPEPRRLLSGAPEWKPGKWNFGLPALHRLYRGTATYETEREYLVRLDLLTPDEREALCRA